MHITLAINVDHPDELPRILKALAGQSGIAPVVSVPADPAQPTGEPAEKRGRGRGRPPKANSEADTSPAEETPAEPVREPSSEVAPVAPPAPPAPPAPFAPAKLARADVQETLINLVKKHGRDKCGELCRKYGGANLSALDPAVWPALVADAQKLIDADAE